MLGKKAVVVEASLPAVPYNMWHLDENFSASTNFSENANVFLLNINHLWLFQFILNVVDE